MGEACRCLELQNNDLAHAGVLAVLTIRNEIRSGIASLRDLCATFASFAVKSFSRRPLRIVSALSAFESFCFPRVIAKSF